MELDSVVINPSTVLWIVKKQLGVGVSGYRAERPRVGMGFLVTHHLGGLKYSPDFLDGGKWARWRAVRCSSGVQGIGRLNVFLNSTAAGCHIFLSWHISNMELADCGYSGPRCHLLNPLSYLVGWAKSWRDSTPTLPTIHTLSSGIGARALPENDLGGLCNYN